MNDNVRPPKARVRGEGRRDGRSPEDIPDGLVDWDEHYQAWEGYARQTTDPKSPEAIEALGGFTYHDLQKWLGRNPGTWEVGDPIRYRLYVRDPKDSLNPEELEELKPAVKIRSHIRYQNGERICNPAIRVLIPDGPILFDATEAEACRQCESLLEKWVEWWKNYMSDRG